MVDTTYLESSTQDLCSTSSIPIYPDASMKEINHLCTGNRTTMHQIDDMETVFDAACEKRGDQIGVVSLEHSVPR